MFKPLTFISTACLLLSSNFAFSEQNQHWQNKQYIQDSFIKVALQSEHKKSDGLLHKWQQPIFYSIIDRTGDQSLHKKMVTQQFTHLASITGHEIAPASGENKTNVTVIFSSEEILDDELRQKFEISDHSFRHLLSHNSICIAKFSHDKTANINDALVLIPVDRARAQGKLMACVVEELTQIMGLPNDSDEVYPSIFNDHSFNDFLSGLDYLLLRLLYSPSLTTGMPEVEVRQQLAEITASQEYADLIQNAESLVKKASLENWLD